MTHECFSVARRCSMWEPARVQFFLLMMFNGTGNGKHQTADQNKKTDQQNNTGHGTGFGTSSCKNGAIHAGVLSMPMGRYNILVTG